MLEDRVMAAVATIDDDTIRATIETLVAILDARDGDPDIELNGDETDGNISEDDFMQHYGFGPGCPISDNDGGTEIMPTLPEYDIDQSTGPINEREGHNAWLRSLRGEDDR